jgi:hypothetical protein
MCRGNLIRIPNLSPRNIENELSRRNSVMMLRIEPVVEEEEEEVKQ